MNCSRRCLHFRANRFLNSHFTIFIFIVTAYAQWCIAQADVTHYAYPILFTHNDGQWNKNILYASLKGSDVMCFTRDGLTLIRKQTESKDRPLSKNLQTHETPEMKSDFVSYRFINPLKNMKISSQEKAVTVSHFYYGNDRSRWKEYVSNFRNLKYKNVWRNIDVEYDEQDGKLQQTVIVKPGGKLFDVQLAMNNSSKDDREDLIMHDAYQIENGSRVSVPVVMKKNGNTIAFDAKKYNPNKALYLPGEFSTYFGGSDYDWAGSLALDDSTNIYILGTTTSLNFPVKNAFKNNFTDTAGCDIFLSKFKCDGTALLFSTYFGGSNYDWGGGGYGGYGGYGGGWGWGGNGLVIGNDHSIYFHGRTRSKDFPTTSNALKKNYPTIPPNYSPSELGYLSRFDLNGMLLYSSYFYSSKSKYPGYYNYDAWIQSLTLDHSGNVVIAGMARDSLEYITQNSFQPDLGRSRDSTLQIFVLKLTPTCESVIHGTYLGGTSTFLGYYYYDWLNGLTVDSENNIIVTGSTISPDFPTKNAFQDTINYVIYNYRKYRLSDCFVTKLDSNLSALIFSTYYGGKYYESNWGGYGYGYGWGGDNTITVDKQNNIYVVGSTNSPDLPLRNPLQSKLGDPITPTQLGYGDVFITKFSPSGYLLYSSYLGGEFGDYPAKIFIDQCSDIVVSGWTNSLNFPLDYPVDSLSRASFLTVIDSSGSSIRASYNLTHFYYPYYMYPYNYNYVWGYGNFEYRDGYLYNVGATIKNIPTFNAFQDSLAGKSDVVITRLSLPFCSDSYLICSLTSIDSIRIDTSKNHINPVKFDITINLENTHSTKIAENVSGDFVLPAGLILDPPNQSLHIQFSPSTILPGQKTSLTLHVRVDTTVFHETSYQILFTGLYRDPTINQLCPLAPVGCVKVIPIRAFTIPNLSLQCFLEILDSLQLNIDASGYIQNPLSIKYVLINRGNIDISIHSINLYLPPDVKTIPDNDLQKKVLPLHPSDTVIVTWKILLPNSLWMRDIKIGIAVIDTFTYEQIRCEKLLVIPPVNPLLCSSVQPDTIRYDPSTQTFHPDPFRALFYLHNKVDTLIYFVDATLDLSKAPHLAFASGEIQNKTMPFIVVNGKEPFAWNLNVNAPDEGTFLDTLVMRYQTPSNQEWRQCEMIVVIERKHYNVLLICQLQAADSLTLNSNGDGYLNNPFPLTFSLKNVGLLSAPLQYIELQAQLDKGISIFGNMKRNVASLVISDSLEEQWQVRAQRSHYWREIVFTVLVVDTSSKEIMRCDKNVLIPPIENDLVCAMSGQDTIRFNSSTQSYEPDPFTISLQLTNQIDTLQYNIDASLDFIKAKHTELAVGESLSKNIFSIPVGGMNTLDWKLRVPKIVSQQTYDTLVIRYRYSGLNVWKECQWIIVIEEGKIARASCAAVGRDSIWYDQQREIYLPDSILVQYTLTNTGTMPLTACTAAILLPNEFTLINKADSIQVYDLLQPNQSQSRYWMLSQNMRSIIDTTIRIQWKWNCNEFSGDTSCVHSVIITTKSKEGLIVTPWMLRFRAKQNGPLPNAKQISLWTSNMMTIPWQATTSLPWLNAQPQSSDKAEVINVQPTTTTLPLGVYTGTLQFKPISPYTPVDVQVEYEIYTITNISHDQIPSSFYLGQNYPNPFSQSTTINIDLTRPTVTFSYEEKDGVRSTFKVYDIFGREVLDLSDKIIDNPPSADKLTIHNYQLPTNGIYFYRLTVGNEAQMKMMTLMQ